MSSTFASWYDTDHRLCHTRHGQSCFDSGPIKANSLWQFGTPVRYNCVYTNDKNGKPRRGTGIPCVSEFSNLSKAFFKFDYWTIIESSQQMHWLESDNECIMTSKPGRFLLRGSLVFISEIIELTGLLDLNDMHIDEKNELHTGWKELDASIDIVLSAVLELSGLVGIVREYVYLKAIGS
jgi:hypothetical protein